VKVVDGNPLIAFGFHAVGKFWDFFKGGMEVRDDFNELETAKRELREEATLECFGIHNEKTFRTIYTRKKEKEKKRRKTTLVRLSNTSSAWYLLMQKAHTATKSAKFALCLLVILRRFSRKKI
jgi:8-oxo-dGTP pyrophosphatase MutT (NUDIX family)